MTITIKWVPADPWGADNCDNDPAYVAYVGQVRLYMCAGPYGGILWMISTKGGRGCDQDAHGNVKTFAQAKTAVSQTLKRLTSGKGGAEVVEAMAQPSPPHDPTYWTVKDGRWHFDPKDSGYWINKKEWQIEAFAA
jgi:hypothetical protein